MISQKFLLRPLAVAALFCVCGASQAAFTVYTTQAAFDAAVINKGTDTFAGFSITGTTPTPIVRTTSVGTAYTYTADAPDDFYGAGSTTNPWLSTNTATDSITFSGFTGGATAIGGNFFGSDVFGAFAAGSITLVATDAGGSATQTITGATVSSFLGFVSTGPLTSLTVTAVQPDTGFLWPTVDNLQIAVTTPIPEPGTYALMFAGLGIVGFMARRRRN